MNPKYSTHSENVFVFFLLPSRPCDAECSPVMLPKPSISIIQPLSVRHWNLSPCAAVTTSWLDKLIWPFAVTERSGCNCRISFIPITLFKDPIKCVNTWTRLRATCGDSYILCVNSLGLPGQICFAWNKLESLLMSDDHPMVKSSLGMNTTDFDVQNLLQKKASKVIWVRCSWSSICLITSVSAFLSIRHVESLFASSFKHPFAQEEQL